MGQSKVYRDPLHFGVSVIALTLVLAAAPARGGTVTITPGGRLDTNVAGASRSRLPVNPLAIFETVRFNNQINTTSYFLNDDGFDIGIVRHSRNGVPDQQAFSSGLIDFTIAPDTPGGVLSYTAAGDYDVVDLSNTPGRVFFFSRLVDGTAGTELYYSYQHSESTANESFTLGGSGGDNVNHFRGNLTGNLIAGHRYRWEYTAYTYAFADSDGGAEAEGDFSLTFNETSVPLPPAVWAGMALMGLIGIKRPKRPSRDRSDTSV